jgi:hypothetical protein
MKERITESLDRLLDPISRISESLFGLFMVLTFTGSLSVGEAGRQDIRTMLVGAIGCNLAWGLVDAVMYLISSVIARGHGLATLRAVRAVNDPQEAHRIISDALPPVAASVLGPEDLEAMRTRLKQLPELPTRPPLRKDDWLGAGAVFLLMFVATFPVVVPFMFMDDAMRALRVSNGIAVAMLFGAGYSLGRYAGQGPWRTGFAMVLIGVALVAITMALGG